MTLDINGKDIPPPPLVPHRSPECPAGYAACRIEISAYPKEPVISWTPTYGADGWPIDTDPNTFITDFNCLTCGHVWQTTRKPEGIAEVSMFSKAAALPWPPPSWQPPPLNHPLINDGPVNWDFGAVGDGITDDTAAIQAALDANFLQPKR